MNETERRALGERVTSARTARGWSKEKLAEVATITTTTLRRIEDGLRVQDAKLQLTLDALGLGRDAETPDRYTEEQMHPMVYVLPPAIEQGYESTVTFARAVSDAVPELSDRATRLIIDAAGLFSDAGTAILKREGGDGNAGDSAPTRKPDSGPGKPSSSGLSVLPTAASKTPTEPSVNRRRRKQDEAIEENQDPGGIDPA